LGFLVVITSVMEQSFRDYFMTPFHTEILTGSTNQHEHIRCVSSQLSSSPFQVPQSHLRVNGQPHAQLLDHRGALKRGL
ncbi:hypothetical protein, partial [Massilia timonae]|uniref:hypothetical protein n=1 Tax=Massilia timonae TaxID=47229 RepID=UPI001C54D803